MKVQIYTKEGFAEIEAVTFLQIVKHIDGEVPHNIERMREIKKELKKLVSKGIVMESDGEPPYYLLKKI